MTLVFMLRVRNTKIEMEKILVPIDDSDTADEDRFLGVPNVYITPLYLTLEFGGDRQL
jgi:hypothetical protein